MSTTVITEEPEVSTPPEEVAVVQDNWFRRSGPTLIFLVRRILSSLLVLIGATFIVFMALAFALDPLHDLRTSTDPNREALMASRIRDLSLDTPAVVRYFRWLGGVVRGDLGTSWVSGQRVIDQLASAIPSTVTLVAGATLLAIGLGILVGIVSALRQYTRFDYGVTFLSFVLYSLPSFWVAVLLKIWGAIGFNDFLANPHVPWYMVLLISLIAGAIWSAVIGGTTFTRWLVFGISAVLTAAILLFISLTDWLIHPSLGIGGIAVLGALVAVGMASLTAGLNNRRTLYATLTTALVGAALYFPMQTAFAGAGWPRIMLLALAALVVGCVIGWLWGGYDRSLSMRASAITAVVIGAFMFIDRLMQIWYSYNRASQINFRPIATIGPATPGIRGDFWVHTLDAFTHILLPTIALILISFAGYTRYTRASMLEVMNQDYIRTARAKGLPERIVTVRHAFRNALIPLATIVPLDIAALFGGAIITERIFAWRGMGSMFITALDGQDAIPIMGYFLVTGTLLVVGSVVVDLVYAALDPRIRVNA